MKFYFIGESIYLKSKIVLNIVVQSVKLDE